ncbi:UBC-like protein [Fomitopsis betulina]|nr:UBC-like protein [Fomitopsis betulina]
MAATALRRIQKELTDVRSKSVDGLSVEPDDANLFVWRCAVRAAPDSPYKGGTFRFTLTLPDNFPFKAPTVVFSTKIYHPGINEEGSICVPVLRDQWKPTVTLSSVLAIIQEKVNNPSPDDPFEPEIAAQMKNDYARFLATAKEWTKKHAMA